jgi:ERCC4-type nuclease
LSAYGDSLWLFIRLKKCSGVLMREMLARMPYLKTRWPHHSRRQAEIFAQSSERGVQHATGGLPRKGKRPQGKLRTQLHILQGLPGVGPERARLLLEAFGSVEAVLTASEEALRSVDGIGVTTVERICWAIREPESVYDVADRESVGLLQ